MSSDRIFLSKPDVGIAEEKALISAIRSGWAAPAGPEIDAFEKEIASRVGVSSAVALTSGTAALHLALLTQGVKPGELVLTSTMTFAATANAIMYVGGIPYFIDSDPVTGNMDPQLLEEALAELDSQGIRPAAVLPVDLLGKVVDYSTISPICEYYGIPIISDAAESLGATHAGKPAGSFGKAAAFSFNGNKIMTTSGGGMLVTNDEEFAAHVRYLSTQARQPVVHYEHLDVGYNYRLSNLLAALGRAQLARLDSMIAQRRIWREAYRELLESFPGIEIFGGDDQEDNCWLTSILINPKEAGTSALDLQRALEDLNIESRPLWKPMHLQPIFRDKPAKISGTSEKLFKSGLTLPSGSGMSEEQFVRVSAALLIGLDR